MSERTQANRAFNSSDSEAEDSAEVLSVLETCDRIIRLKIPNLLRLYLNPFVAQTCVALSEIVHTAWPETRRFGPRPSFLANSGEEALSGALKLARFTLNSRQNQAGQLQKNPNAILIDDLQRFHGFASTTVKGTSGDDQRIDFIPGVEVVSSEAFCDGDKSNASAGVGTAGIVVISTIAVSTNLTALCEQIKAFQQRGGLLIVCLTADWEASRLIGPAEHVDADSRAQEAIVPDIVVFDQSFTNHSVPFGAFSATAEVYSQWTVKGMATFHSTTYQPNTISTMHFLKCLEENSPTLFSRIQHQLKTLLVDHHELRKTFRSLFSPALSRLISASGFQDDDVTASGHFIRVGSRRLFDGVGGVACSLRGHNPDKWVPEMEALSRHPRLHSELSERLHGLTGLRHFVPAVSGGSTVEQALKLALIAQAPRRTVVALQGGFGGKTLFALTGTAKEFYKRQLDPLYQHVRYVDAFASNAVEMLQRVVAENDVAVIQLELVQGVGGVREIPAPLLSAIQAIREERGVLVFVDEIQTGMFRTGPFVRSRHLRFQPDLLTIGKGTSDMMFPFAMTLFSDRIQYLLSQRKTELPEKMKFRAQFEVGYRSVLNTLRQAESDDLSASVEAAGQQFADSLRRHLGRLPIVRDIRVFGLLIGIELDLKNSLVKKLGLNAAQLYLAQMLNHRKFPLLMGYCQYEPHILKFTPPLSVTSEEIEQACGTIADTLASSTVQLIGTGVKALWRSRK